MITWFRIRVPVWSPMDPQLVFPISQSLMESSGRVFLQKLTMAGMNEIWRLLCPVFCFCSQTISILRLWGRMQGCGGGIKAQYFAFIAKHFPF